MIRYGITQAELQAKIDGESPTWRAKAQERANNIKKKKSYSEKTAIWSEIKDVYRKVQGQKCAFRERWLAGDCDGSVEHDVEHFRPKKETKPWTSAAVDKTWQKAGRSQGYYWLAYDVLNYAISCKVCNSALKRNYFPIAKTPGNELSDVATLNQTEEPLLVYPISTIDDDPESLIQFEGIEAVAVNSDTRAHAHRRAAVTIAFFMLNDRRELLLDRARVIKNVFEALEKIHAPGASLDAQREGKAELQMYLDSRHEHANCARSFHRLFQKDEVKAFHLYKAARETYRKLVLGSI